MTTTIFIKAIMDDKTEERVENLAQSISEVRMLTQILAQLVFCMYLRKPEFEGFCHLLEKQATNLQNEFCDYKKYIGCNN